MNDLEKEIQSESSMSADDSEALLVPCQWGRPSEELPT